MKIKYWLLSVVVFVGLIGGAPSHANPGGMAPEFESDFAKKLISNNYEEDTSMFDIKGVRGNVSLKENVECLFYPGAAEHRDCGSINSGYLWNLLRYLTFLAVFIALVYTAIELVMLGTKKDGFKEKINSLLYILLGATMVFLSTRLFGNILPLHGLEGTGDFSQKLIRSDGALFAVLSFLKSLAFFIAILMIVVTGFRVMAAGEMDKGKKLTKGILSILGVLVGIKVIDFIYLIAAQQNFAESAGVFLIQLMKFLGYFAGIAIVTMVIIAGYLFIVDGGSGKSFQKAKNILINILLSVAALFFVLFIIYQIFAEFTG